MRRSGSNGGANGLSVSGLAKESLANGSRTALGVLGAIMASGASGGGASAHLAKVGGQGVKENAASLGGASRDG